MKTMGIKEITISLGLQMLVGKRNLDKKRKNHF